MSDITMQTSNLSVEYNASAGSVQALSDISIDVRAGEFVCILGESGCGKSTLLRVLAGLQEASAGSATRLGKKIVGPSPECGVVFQTPALFPWLSVQRNIELGYRIREERIPTDSIREVITLMGLAGFEQAKPDNLSGGMAQRASIARAIVHRPPVLLMDEPFSALDAMTRIRLQLELRQIWQKHKMTVVFITHDIDEAIMLGTQVAIMTPRPGRMRRLMQVTMPHPRSPRSTDFMRLKADISDELFNLLDDTTLGSKKK